MLGDRVFVGGEGDRRGNDWQRRGIDKSRGGDDVPANATAVGIPARMILKPEPSDAYGVAA